MVAYYASMVVLAAVNLFVFLMLFREKKLNYYILALLAIITVSNTGNFLLATANSIEEAIIAKKIYYVGGCFMPPIMLLLIVKMCNISVRKWIENLFLLYSFAVYTMVFTVGYSDIYYKSVNIIQEDGVTVMHPEYGIGHMFFYILLYGYLLFGIVVLVYSLKKKNQLSHKNLWTLLGMEMLTILIFLLGRVVNRNLETMPLIYVIDGWMLLYLSRRVSMYNLEDNIVSSIGKQDDYGYIMFDKNRNYLGANNLAMKILPELASCKIDRPIKGCDSLQFLQVELDEFEKFDDTFFELDREDEHFEGHINQIWYADLAVGYLFEIENATDRYKYTQLLSTYNENLRSEVEEKTAHIKNIQEKVLFGMANLVENRDGNTGGHIKRTSDVIEILINTIRENHILDLEDSFCKAVIKAAPMHDLGKIAISDDILTKPGKLTDEEFAMMQTHAPRSGELVDSILKDVEDEYFVKIAKNMARHHHEKWNGAGYPDRKKGEEIPLEARIMAIADVYDALVSKRCYKEPMSFEKATEVMMESMGNHFDPQMEEVFVKSRQKLEAYYSG